MTGLGIWADGRISERELMLLQTLMRSAIGRFAEGKLPYKFKDPKITFRAEKQGTELHVFYGWNFPPTKLWITEVKTIKECLNCFPKGKAEDPVREVWCSKLGYNFQQCPYGALTAMGRCPL